MSFLAPPKPPNPMDVASNQLAFGQNAARDQNTNNMINQTNPYGSLNYTADPNAPGGYSANLSLTAPQQAILDQLQGSKINTGSAANSLTSNFGSLYGSPPNIDPSSLTNKMMGWGQQYMQPIFDQQQSNLDAKLQNQGITQGSQAYNNAQNLQSRNVNNAYQNLFLNAEPTAFNQAIQEYQLPMQTAYGLMNSSQPTQQAPIATPTAQIAAPNYQGAAQNAYQGQQANYQAMIGGLSQLAGGIGGGFAGGGGGMFGGGWGGGGTPTGATFAGDGMGMMGGIPFPIF